MVAIANTHSRRSEPRFKGVAAGHDSSAVLRMIGQLYGSDVADSSSGEGEVVLVLGIPFTTCGHHLLPCLGKAHVAYLADGRTVSAARLEQTVNSLARHSQGQRLADALADAVTLHLSAEAVAVVVETDHVCIEWSEAGPIDSRASAVRGRFRAERALGAEVISLLSTTPGGPYAAGIIPEVLFEGVLP